MKILGIDPGLGTSGFGVIECQGSKLFLIDYGYLPLPATQSVSKRVKLFHDFFDAKIVEQAITHVALETPFLGKNAQNFLKLGYLRGILYLLAEKHNATLAEFAPREVKQAVTGFGGAQKDQVARVLLQLFPKMMAPDKADVTDAIAVTLCAAWRTNVMRKLV